MKGATKTVFLQYATFSLQIVLLAVIAKTLGPEEQGRFAIYRSFVYVFESLMWLGLISGTTYFIAREFEKYHDIILSLVFGYLTIVFVVGLIVIHVFLPSSEITLFRGYLSVAWILLLGGQAAMQKVFLGSGRHELFALLNFLNAFTLGILIYIFWWLEAIDLDNVLAAHTIATGLTILAALFGHRQQLRRFRIVTRIAWQDLKTLWSVGMKGYISSLAFLLFYRIDFFFVGYFLGAKTLGQYTVAVFIVEAVQKLPDWLGLILVQRVANGVDPQRKIQNRYLKISLAAVSVVAVMLLLFWLLDFRYGSMIFGAQYTDVELFVMLLFPKSFIYCVMVINAAFLSGRGYTLYHPLGGLAALLALVMLDVKFLPEYGINAAFFAVTIAMSVSTLIIVFGVGKQQNEVAAAT